MKRLSERTDLQALAAEIVEKCKLIHPSKVMQLSIQLHMHVCAWISATSRTYVAVPGLKLPACMQAWDNCWAHSVHGLSKQRGQLPCCCQVEQ